MVTALDKYREKLFLGSSHSWAITRALTWPTTSRVLDIGAGSGVIGAALAQRGFTELSAIEIDAAARAQCESLYRKVGSSLEDFSGSQFDLILLLDVLEHVQNSEELLVKTTQLLRPGGTILISLPNVAHWSVRFQLLFGFFEYTDRGLLDRTHLQFFNKRRVLKMINSCKDLQLIDLCASIAPLEFVLPSFFCNNSAFRLLSQTRLKLGRLFHGMLAYQHLIEVKKI